MTRVKSIEQLSLVLGYVVAGLIILCVRAQFLTGWIRPNKDALLSYFTLSVIYRAVMNAAVLLFAGSAAPLQGQTRFWLPIILAGAVIFGVLIGLNVPLGATRSFLRHCELHLPDVLHSAWDWRFSRFPPSPMTITLKDASGVSDWCGEVTFIGSDPKDRDLYIDQL